MPRTVASCRRTSRHFQRTRSRTEQRGKPSRPTRRNPRGTRTSDTQATTTRTLCPSNTLCFVRTAPRLLGALRGTPRRIRTALLRALWKELHTVQRNPRADTTRASSPTSLESRVRSHGNLDPCYVDSELDGNCLGCYTGNWERSHHVRNCEYRGQHTDQCNKEAERTFFFVCSCDQED